MGDAICEEAAFLTANFYFTPRDYDKRRRGKYSTDFAMNVIAHYSLHLAGIPLFFIWGSYTTVQKYSFCHCDAF